MTLKSAPFPSAPADQVSIKQDLSTFKMPSAFRGRSAAFVQFWWIVQALIFRPSPQVAYGLRRWLLRCFGADIGKGVLIRPSVTVTYPWKLKIGDYSWIGDEVTLYTLGPITIGSHSVVSQKSYLCAADHDYNSPSFPIRSRPITISDQVWIATDVFVAPGVAIGEGVVVGARSSVFKDLAAGQVCVGSPCVPVKPRSTDPREDSFV